MCVYIYVQGLRCHSVCIEVIGQLEGLSGFLLLPSGIQGSNWGLQDWGQEPLPAAPSHYSSTDFFLEAIKKQKCMFSKFLFYLDPFKMWKV